MYQPAHVRPGKIRSANLPTHRGQAVRLEPLLQGEEPLAQWQSRVDDPAELIVLDLFCGAGGMSQGFASEGFFVAAGIDSDPVTCETHAANFSSKTLCLDLSGVQSTEQAKEILKQLGIPRVDVIVGGPPCQGFSIVGRARIRSLPKEEQRKEILKRNHLYRPFFHFVEAAQPLLFALENVQTMKSWESGSVFGDMLEIAARLDYETYTDVLNAADYGVPQLRRRQFVVGSHVGRAFRFPSPRFPMPVTLEEAIGDLPHVSAPSLYETIPYTPRRIGLYQQLMRSRVPQEDAELVHDHVVRPVRDDDREIFSTMEPGHRYIDIDARYRRYKTDSFVDKYYMLKPDAPCVTITAHMAKDGYRYIHWDREQCRTLSVREAARAQSFDDAFRFAGHRSSRYRQIGNAVPPLLAQELAISVRRAIKAGGRQLFLPFQEQPRTSQR